MLLESLRNQSRPPREIVVADSGSTDGTVEIARAAGATVVKGERKGPGEGRNRGAEAARGDVLLFLDADCVAPARLVDSVVDGSPLVGAGNIGISCNGTSISADNFGGGVVVTAVAAGTVNTIFRGGRGSAW